VLADAITERTKALILCSPSNPTGAAYTREQLRALADVAKQKGDFWIIVDEIYGELVYDGFDQRSLLEVAPELKHRLIIVDGVSKTFSMTGWRIGWALAPAPVVKAMDKMQGQSTTNPTAVAQHAAAAALAGDKGPAEAMRAAFAERRGVFIAGLDAIEGIRCRAPEGAFYAFPNVQALIGRKAGGVTLTDDLAIARWLLEEARCAVVPGSAFEAPGYLRMSYATSMERLEEGLRRIREAVAKLG
jgi:aspartate aminotransferase